MDAQEQSLIPPETSPEEPTVSTKKRVSFGWLQKIVKGITVPFRLVAKVLRKLTPRPLKFLLRPFVRIFNKFPLPIRILLIIVPMGVFCYLFYAYIIADLPTPTKLGEIPVATKIYDRHGVHLYDIYAEQNRAPLPLSEIPKIVQQATLSIEDKDFYKHGGVNPIGGILRAAYASLSRKNLQGGSTITQQLVKSALLTQDRTVIRKIREIILASWTEMVYPKDKILEMYLNQVPYGGTAWGIETAAQKYFGKSVKNLSLAEAALLAGLPQAPTLYSPFGNYPELGIQRQKQVLHRMVEDKYITQEQADAAAKEELVFKKDTELKAPHFVMYVKQLLVDKYGESTVEKGGLKVTTTLDLKLQEYAQATVASEVDDLKYLRVSNGAALITKPATGEILTMVGSADYFATDSGTFNVTTALRQPGSSIKPINYAIGIEKKIVTPASVFLDVPTCFSSFDQPTYCPKNYDGKFHGVTHLRAALAQSLNIPAVKMLYLNTVEDMVSSASAFGLSTFVDSSKYGLSLTLGGGEVHMTDMAEAFSVFANGGIRKDLVAIRKVVDKNEKVLFEYQDENLDKEIPSDLLLKGPRVLSRETAYLISNILADNGARTPAFGPSSSLVIPKKTVSVKTGTTDDLRDNWTIGYTPLILVATWVGNNDSSPMNPNLVSGVTGAAPIWNALMKHALEDKPDVLPKKPDSIVGLSVCNLSGLLPPNSEGDPGCPTMYEYFIKGTTPTMRENLKKGIWIDKETGDIAAPGKTENVEAKDVHMLFDGVTNWCLDCVRTDPNKPVIVRQRY